MFKPGKSSQESWRVSMFIDAVIGGCRDEGEGESCSSGVGESQVKMGVTEIEYLWSKGF